MSSVREETQLHEHVAQVMIDGAGLRKSWALLAERESPRSGGGELVFGSTDIYGHGISM
jgi:hypothetical protein